VYFINHVSVPVDDIDRAVAFYEDWFGAHVVPSAAFPVPVAWLMVGKIQLHLVQNAATPAHAYHFGVAIEDRAQFEALYWRAEREGHLDHGLFDNHIYEMPGGVVQLYMTDSANNIVEVDYPYVDDLDPKIVDVMARWADATEQSEWNKSSTLFMDEQGIFTPESSVTDAGDARSTADMSPETAMSATSNSAAVAAPE
jgi:catechol 2,3-dioxygenase-like lactoylglutathione lyase family enzyme